MNFYSNEIENQIIDNEPIEDILESIDTFKLQCKYVIMKHSARVIHYKYTNWLLNDPNVVIVFYCLDNEFCIYNCPSILIYRRVKYGDDIRYYVLFTCTVKKFRGQGYASKLLDELKIKIKNENAGKTDKVKIVLSSLEEAVLFYEAYGFRWTRESITDHPLLMYYESYEEKKDYFIMELIIDVI